MFVLQKALNGWHLKTAFCLQLEEWKRNLLAEKEAQVGAEAAITAYWTPLSLVTSFKCLGRFLLAVDDDWPAVIRIPWRAW